MRDEQFLERVRELNGQFQMFVEISDAQQVEGRFHFSAKDNLCTRGMETRAGSRILDGYSPPFDATAVKRLREAGGFLLGKTNMDEFGFGTFSTNSGYGVPLNPFDRKRACGGSSGGAAAAASLIEEHVALGVSTGGSISCPAAFCGVVGFTPTYGRVSRYGLVDYGNSLDKVGLLSSTVSQIQEYFPVIAGPDPEDPTSMSQPELDLHPQDIKSIAVPEGTLSELEPGVSSKFEGALNRMVDELGLEVEEVSMPSLEFALPAYYILATSEASTNLARYSGMRFGVREEEVSQHYNDFFSGVRSENFGKEAKRRILLGTFSRMVGFRDRYYMKALSVREAVIDDYRAVFEEHDLVVTPTMPFPTPKFSEIEEMTPLDAYLSDVLTVPPNLSGLPHISVPCGYIDNLPLGMQMVGPHWDEATVLEAARAWERTFEFRKPEALK